METDSGATTARPRRHGRALSRPATDLGVIARGEPRIEELLALLDEPVDTGRRIGILQEIARVYREDLDDTEAAMVALRAALLEDFSHRGVIAALEDLAETAGAWNELLSELIHDAASLESDNRPGAADLWARIARWYLEPMGYRGYATDALRNTLRIEPDHADALALLSGILRDDGYHHELAGVLERRADIATDPADKVEILLELADVAEMQLDDHNAALAACRAALAADPGCLPVYDVLRSLLRYDDCVEEIVALLADHAAMIEDPEDCAELTVEIARLYEDRLGDTARAELAWDLVDPDDAVARLTELVDAKPGPAQAAALHYRIGRFRMAGDEERAEWHLWQALAENPAHVRAACELAHLYRRRGDFAKASRMLDRAIEHTPDPTHRVALVTDNARILVDELGDLDGAAAMCRDALASGQSTVALTLVLARICARQGEWDTMRAMLADIEPAIVDAGDTADIHTLYKLIAQASAELGDRDGALAYYAEAHALAPDDADARRALADEHYAREQWREAARAYRALIDLGESAAADPAVRYRLGVALRESGNRAGALDAFTGVLDVEPAHRPALRARAELLAALGRWDEAAAATRALLDAAPTDEAAAIQLELGDLYRDHLDQPRRALGLYTAAVDAAPRDHAALQRRLDLATALGEWSVAIDTIEKFAATEDDLHRRGAYLHAAAVIQRDELRELDTAADMLERALDTYFATCPTGEQLTRALRTFAELDTLHTQRRAWQAQAASYQRMIGRLPAEHPVLVELWHALGEVYRSRLGDLHLAATAFEAARSLQPDHMERRAILAELYDRTHNDDAAADEHHAMLAREPGRAESYRALKELYAAAGKMDQAWCACRALVFLDRAERDERELYERYHAHALADMKGTLTAAMQRQLDPTAGDTEPLPMALALVRPLVAVARPNPLRLDDDQAIDTSADRAPRVRLLTHIAAALDRPLPDLYDQRKKPGQLAFGARLVDGAARAAIALRADYLRCRETTAAFHAARTLCLLDPARAITAMVPAAELRAVADWIVGRGGENKLAAALTRAAERTLRPDQHEQLLELRRALRDTDLRRAVDRYLRRQTLVSDRIGFVVCGDLGTAAGAIARFDPAEALPGLPVQARILELLRFSVTAEHAAIRRHLCGRI